MAMKGIVMTLDAIVALTLMASIISLLIFFRIESSSPFYQAQQLHSLSEDSLNILSESTLAELITNTTLNNSLKQNGILSESDFSKNAIDVIGMLWAQNNTTSSLAAVNITKDILGSILPNNIGYQVLINNDSMYNSSQEPRRPLYENATIEISSGRIASGYQKGQNVTGCVARAYLKSFLINDSSYVYFGGYVGEGNITVNITLPPLDNILEAYMEMDAGSNFTLYMNGFYAGDYKNGTAGGGLMRADKWTVCNSTYNPSYCSKLTAGNNTLNFNFSSINNSFIGGGYFRITYNTTRSTPTQGYNSSTYWFPGITGFFNLYDSFYVPGTLTSMSSYLHYYNNLTYNSTNATVYIEIGNVTVFTSNSSGEQRVNLSYNNFTSAFGNSTLLINNVSNGTVPLRLGFEEFQVKPGVGTADAVLTTDVSGSMGYCMINNPYGTQCDCGTPGTSTCRRDKIVVARNTDDIFVDTVLSSPGNRVSLVSYSDSVAGYHPLSNNSAALKGNISRYTGNGCTCTSCGVDNATKAFYCDPSWNSAKCAFNGCNYNGTTSTCNVFSNILFRGILVMTDGLANQCLNQNNHNYCGAFGSVTDCNHDDTDPFYPPKLEAINLSCKARDMGYTIFSVGFGSDADNITLQRIACWNCSACRLDCNNFTFQGDCPSTQCYWNYTNLANKTVFYDNFESWSTGSDCSFSSSWNACLDTSNSIIRGDNNNYANGSQALKTAHWNDLFPNSEALIKCLNLTNYSKAYLTFSYRSNLPGSAEYGNISINTSSSSWVSIWNKSGSTSGNNFYAVGINITKYISSKTCIGIRQKSSSNNDWVNYDDFRVVGSLGSCNIINDSSCWIGNVTLPNGTQADCRAVRFAQSSNINELTSIYQGFGQWFANLGYVTQKANITGSINFNNVLYPDSHIDLQYSQTIAQHPYGEISVTLESPRLGNLTGNNTTTGNNTYKEGWFNVPKQVAVVDSKITSYSSDYWTDMLWINSSATSNWKGVYNLTLYGNDYTSLGDPFMIYIPTNYISQGNNSVRIETGFPFNKTFNRTGGSPDDKVIYTLTLNGSVGYGSVNQTCQGAVQDAEQRLLNLTGGFVSGQTQNETTNISSIQYMWGPAIVRIRLWS